MILKYFKDCLKIRLVVILRAVAYEVIVFNWIIDQKLNSEDSLYAYMNMGKNRRF